MNKPDILPPGEHPRDSRKPDIDQVAYALSRVQVFLVWIDEHRASFEKERNTNPQSAESELDNLRDSTDQAVLHLQRLTELLLAGYRLDTDKPAPKNLCNDNWRRWVELLRKQRAGRGG